MKGKKKPAIYWMKKYKPGAIRTPIFFFQKKEEIKCSCENFKLSEI